jgi:nitroreductase
MQVMEAIRRRRSIRRYKVRELPVDDLELLLEAARLAPSGANRQPWEMVVVTDPKRIRELAPICKNQTFLENCNLFLAGVDDPQQKWARVDLAIALDHLSLAAEELGLGSCWIGAFDQERLANLLGVPKGKVVTVCMALGYPDETPEARPRRPMEELFHYNRYGKH